MMAIYNVDELLKLDPGELEDLAFDTYEILNGHEQGEASDKQIMEAWRKYFYTIQEVRFKRNLL